MIAGGASFAPRRWSFPGLEADIRNSAALSSTAAITADKNRRNCLLSYGVLPGLNKFFPVLVTKDQLSCFRNRLRRQMVFREEDTQNCDGVPLFSLSP